MSCTHRPSSWVVCLMLCAFGLLLTSCGKKDLTVEDDKVVMVEDDDPEMEAAMKKGADTLDKFIKVLQAPSGQETHLAIKVPVRDGDNVEFFWLSSVKYDGKKFQGKVDNVPNNVHTVKMGDTITVERADVVDWCYMKGDKLWQLHA